MWWSFYLISPMPKKNLSQVGSTQVNDSAVHSKDTISHISGRLYNTVNCSKFHQSSLFFFCCSSTFPMASKWLPLNDKSPLMIRALGSSPHFKWGTNSHEKICSWANWESQTTAKLGDRTLISGQIEKKELQSKTCYTNTLAKEEVNTHRACHKLAKGSTPLLNSCFFFFPPFEASKKLFPYTLNQLKECLIN